MTDRKEIERLLNQTGRTLEGLPKEYPGDKCRAVGRVRGLTPAVAGNSILHQSDVIELLVGALRDALEKQPKWISVEERLPEMHDDGSVDAVLVTDGFLIHMAYCADGLWLFCENGEMKEPMFYDVTHWMPLPSAPKEEG